MKINCKACGNGVKLVDLRGLCTHCAFRIDTADAEASDINGIREDMWQVGIPTSGYTRSLPRNWEEYLDDDLHVTGGEDESN